MNRLNKYLDDQKEAISRINLERVIEISEHLMQTATEGNNIWVAGNGGSATTAAHLVTDLTKGCYEKTKIQHPAICLNESLGAFSAWSNDYSYNDALSFELQSLGKIGDCFIAISGSGNSKNLINALEASKRIGMSSVTLLGMGGGSMKNMANIELIIESNDMQIVENCHLIVAHAIFKTLSTKAST